MNSFIHMFSFHFNYFHISFKFLAELCLSLISFSSFFYNPFRELAYNSRCYPQLSAGNKTSGLTEGERLIQHKLPDS